MPLAYALAELLVAEEAHLAPGLLRVAFLDDLTLVGPRDAVRCAFAQLRVASVPAGLDFNEAKCVAVSLAAEADRVAFPGWRLEPLGDFSLLGSCCGDSAAVDAFAARALSKAAVKARRLLALREDPHLQYLLLRYTSCFAVGGYYARTCGPTEALQPFDKAMLGAGGRGSGGSRCVGCAAN